MTYENISDRLPSLLFPNPSTTLRSRQHQQRHCTLPLVIVDPPSFLSLLFHRYFTISFGDRQGSRQILTPLRERVQKYDTSLVDPSPIGVHVCTYRCLCTITSLYVFRSAQNYPTRQSRHFAFHQSSSRPQFKMATCRLLSSRHPIPWAIAKYTPCEPYTTYFDRPNQSTLLSRLL